MLTIALRLSEGGGRREGEGFFLLRGVLFIVPVLSLWLTKGQFFPRSLRRRFDGFASMTTTRVRAATLYAEQKFAGNMALMEFRLAKGACVRLLPGVMERRHALAGGCCEGMSLLLIGIECLLARRHPKRTACRL